MLKSISSAFEALFSCLRPWGKIPAADGPRDNLEEFRVPSVPNPTTPKVSGEPEWMRLARADIGLKEKPGKAAEPRILEAFKCCAYEPASGDEDAWCSAMMCLWMESAGLPHTKAPNARSWMNWGSKLDKPKPGCVVVFWRGSPTSWQGHVALYVGPGKKPGTIRVLGGNQGNCVCEQDYSAAQVLSYRWPVTGSTSRTLKATTAGTIGDITTMAALTGKTLLESAPDALAFSDGVRSLAEWWPAFALVGIVLSLATRAIVIYARLHTWQEKAA
jgi:uncharacterized protein (TIGR02594 family)